MVEGVVLLDLVESTILKFFWYVSINTFLLLLISFLSTMKHIHIYPILNNKILILNKNGQMKSSHIGEISFTSHSIPTLFNLFF